MESYSGRLFFALWPDQHLRERLEDVARQLPEHRGRVGHPLDWHVTLRFLGQVSAQRFSCVEDVAGRIDCDGFRMRFDAVGYWRRPRIIWCRPSVVPDALQQLVADLQRGLKGCGFKPEFRPYSPHITLVRKARPVEDYRLSTPLHWEPTEFVLAGSQGGGRPPRYRVFRRWKL